MSYYEYPFSKVQYPYIYSYNRVEPDYFEGLSDQELVVVDCANLEADHETLFEAFYDVLNFELPSAGNWNAFWDCITDYPFEPSEIKILHLNNFDVLIHKNYEFALALTEYLLAASIFWAVPSHESDTRYVEHESKIFKIVMTGEDKKAIDSMIVTIGGRLYTI